MNYTDWIKANIPDMADSSNIEMTALIDDAKKTCYTYIVIMKSCCIMAALVIANIIGSPFNISIFNSANGFVLAIVAVIIGEIVSQKFITARMKKMISQLAAENT